MTSSRVRMSTPSWDHWFVSGFCALIPLVLFLWALVRYMKYDFVDRKTGSLVGLQESWNLIILLALPLIGHFITIGFLLNKARQDRAVNRFYKLCLLFIAIGPFGYCLLWLLYTFGKHASQEFSYLALVFVALLLVIVGFVTYLLMWTPANLAAVNEDDIVENMSGLCSTLRQSEDNDASPHMAKLFGAFADALKEDLRKSAASDEVKRSKLEGIINSLNSIVRQEAFFVDHFHEMQTTKPMHRLQKKLSHSNLSPEQRQRISALLNLMLLRSCLPHVISRVPRSVRLRTVLDGPLEDLKNGMFSSRFVTLIFFFSVFLVVSYLLGFAFAFDDQARISNSQPPALFMARTHPSAATAAPLIPDQNTIAGERWPEYTFYFDDKSLTVQAPSNNTKDDLDYLLSQRSEIEEEKKTAKTAADETKISKKLARGRTDRAHGESLRKLWEKELSLKNKQAEIAADVGLLKPIWNYDHMQRLARAIEDEATNGNGIVLELDLTTPIRSDDVGQTTKPDRKLSANDIHIREEEIKRQVQYLLLSQSNKTMPRNIEWFAPHPVTAQATPTQLYDKYSTEHKNLAERNMIFRNQFARLLGQRWLSLLLNESLCQIGEIERKHATDPDNELINHKLEDSVVMLRDVRQLLEANHVDNASEQTTMSDITVSVRPVRDTVQFIPLGLMDYMYFTMYTITTTGYGDIVPTTNYAKFLCTLANILEVFFVVVFFNALLAGKMQRQDQHLDH